MSSTDAARSIAPDDLKARQRAVWALGDYDRVARDVLAPFGPALVDACGIGAGRRVLDVAAGTGNVALAAAQAGASVVACDLTPALLDVGRARAAELGLTIDWIEADAEALPFAGATFDVVTSAVGVMFAPDQRTAARELVRVCRPGGMIGLVNWTPESWSAQMFAVLAAHVPPPPGPPPVLWGDVDHLRDLLGRDVAALETARHDLVVDHFAAPADVCDYYREHFGPIIASYAALAGAPERRAALDRDLDAFAARTDEGAPGRSVYRLEYLLAIARRAGSGG